MKSEVKKGHLEGPAVWTKDWDLQFDSFSLPQESGLSTALWLWHVLQAKKF
jgi:hypothetical protein